MGPGRNCLTASGILAALFLSQAAVAQTGGRVVKVEGETVTVEADPPVWAAPGDRLEIYFRIQGVESDFEIAVAQATEMQGGLVIAKVTEEKGRPAPHQLVRIFATGTGPPAGGMPSGKAPLSAVEQLHGHTGMISSVAFAEDGGKIWTTAEDLRQWDPATGEVLRRFEFTGNPPLCFSATPDGRLAAAGLDDHSIQLWDLESGRVLKTLRGHTSWISATAISPDGKRILSGAGEVVLEESPSNPAGAAVTVRRDCTVRLWDAGSGTELLKLSGHLGTVRSVAFSPDGRFALSASTDRTTRLWDLESGQQIGQLIEPRPLGMLAVAFSPDGGRCLTASGGYPEVEEDPQPFSSEDLSIGNSGAAEAVSEAGFALRLWDLGSGRHLRTLIGHTREAEAIAFLPDGKHVLSGSYDRTVRLWDAESGLELRQFTGHEMSVQRVAVSGDGRYGISGDTAGTVRIWPLGLSATAGGPPVAPAHDPVPPSGGWLGAMIGELDAGQAEQMGLGQSSAVQVLAVEPDSPADLFGLKKLDVITGVDGSPVADSQAAIAAVARKGPGEVMTLDVTRGGLPQRLQIKLGRRPDGKL